MNKEPSSIVCCWKTKMMNAQEAVDVLKNERVCFVDGKLKVFIKDDLYSYSSSIIGVRKDGLPSEKVHQWVLNKIENEERIQKVVSAVNSICLFEDRQVFVERMVYHQKVSKIIKNHCLSNNGYYACLNRAINDFEDYLHL